MLIFHFVGLATTMRRPCVGLRKTPERLQYEIWPEFRIALQRYGEHLPFSKFFENFFQILVIFYVFLPKNSDFLERTRSSICCAVLE